MALRVCLYLTLLLSTATGSVRLGFQSSIIGGRNASPGQWPWMVALRITDGKHDISCGGSLIDKQWVMTAAHCINNCHVKSVVVGRLKLRENTGREYSVRRVVTHPGYDPLMIRNDLALIQLDKPVVLSRYVNPIPLPTPMDVFNTRSECWITGWGRVADNVRLGGKKTLQQLRVPLLDQKTCKSRWRNNFSDKQLCAGYLRGGKGTCNGDGGGPLVCKSYGRFVQVGVASFRAKRGCVLAGYPGGYTRVLSYIDFIYQVVRQYS